MDSGFGAQSLEFRGLGYYNRHILGLYWGYIGVILGIEEKKMETTFLFKV